MSEVEVSTPVVQSRTFKNMDAALDFCKFTQPEELTIRRAIVGVEVVGYQLIYTGSSGQK